MLQCKKNYKHKNKIKKKPITCSTQRESQIALACSFFLRSFSHLHTCVLISKRMGCLPPPKCLDSFGRRSRCVYRRMTGESVYLLFFNSQGRQVQYVCCQFSKSPYFIGSPFWLSRAKLYFLFGLRETAVWAWAALCNGQEKRLQFRLRDYQKTISYQIRKKYLSRSLNYMDWLNFQINQKKSDYLPNVALSLH